VIKDFVSWVYGKDFTFWQNIGHLAVTVLIFVFVFGVIVK
jgi:hypothetical protein